MSEVVGQGLRDDKAAPVVRVFSASHDGQAARIAAHVAGRLTAAGCAVFETALTGQAVPAAAVAPAALVVLIASIRYGYHQPATGTLLATYRGLASPPPIAVATVCLTARRANRQTADNNPYLRRLIARHGLRPVAAAAIAGRLAYPLYGWFDRQMIRLIMAMMKGPTDGVSTVEFTDWAQVDAFADDLRRAAGA